jgi:hypothetical protein
VRKFARSQFKSSGLRPARFALRLDKRNAWREFRGLPRLITGNSRFHGVNKEAL